MANIKILMANKYGIKPAVVKDGIHYPVTSMENKLRKLMTDKQLLIDVLKELYRDLCLNDGFQWFIQFLAQSRIDERRLQMSEDEVARNRAKFKELRKQLRTQRNNQKSTLYEFEGNFDRLRHNIEDTEQIGIFKTVYHIKWQRSRREQFMQSITDVQDESAHSIRYFKDKLLAENRVHNELEHWNTVVINEYLMEIEKTMSKYDRDVEAMDLQIRTKKSELNRMIDEREARRRLIVQHEEEMEAWMKFKDDRAAEKLYKMIMLQSALIVQAWWRGLLVRQQLGPFRPKKEKAKPKTTVSTAKPEKKTEE
ncbi:dynein regulatory complex protein 9-like [Pectinophora gossypiella]|uniref:dynein regulatory complex protein 9-like n=1 Tax=Pectinophora gossypiella TaxID=13191 RepID=UPI00214E94C4|nr:dynein regulatory complex protein 9-like [Pectinophora gossypiella]